MRVAKLNTRANVFVGDHGEMSTFFASSKGDVVECLDSDIPGVAMAGDFSIRSHRDQKQLVYVARAAVSSYVLAEAENEKTKANPMAAAHAALAAKRAGAA